MARAIHEYQPPAYWLPITNIIVMPFTAYANLNQQLFYKRKTYTTITHPGQCG